MSKTVLFVLTSHKHIGNTLKPTGFYLPEAAHPWAVLVDAGFKVVFTSPQGGKPPMDGTDSAITAPVCQRFLADAHVQAQLADTPTPETLNPADYAAIFYVCGHGTMWDFPDHTTLASLASSIYGEGGVVAAVCHGPAALVNVKGDDGTYLVQGKRVAAFTDSEEHAVGLATTVPFLLASKLQERGAIHQPAADWVANVVVDGHLVTGQNPASATGVGEALVQVLTAMS
jgi:putative intracellular protease/amidase